MTREEAMTRVKGILTDCIPLEDSGEIDEIMEALEPKTGHWIFDKEKLGYWISTCSECGHIFHGNEVLMYKPKFCAHCGARMVKLQESEDKE